MINVAARIDAAGTVAKPDCVHFTNGRYRFMKLEMAADTDPGLLREHNEDALTIDPEAGLAILSDGMGGHQAGEVASRIAIDRIIEEMNGGADAPNDDSETPAQRLVAAVKAANTEIVKTAAMRPEYYGMGATVVAMSFHDNRYSSVHLGDSRLYQLRNGKLTQLTEDHSLVQEFVRQGVLSPDEARASVNKNLITRALGIGEEADTEINEGGLEVGDIYLLCSDGLSDVVAEDEIAATLKQDDLELESAVRELIHMANAGGGPDNISVILVRVLELDGAA
jgi:serine/threonine protein phosphatase PrpC